MSRTFFGRANLRPLKVRNLQGVIGSGLNNQRGRVHAVPLVLVPHCASPHNCRDLNRQRCCPNVCKVNILGQVPSLSGPEMWRTPTILHSGLLNLNVPE